MSLTTCLKKAGAAIHPEDKAAILDRARALRAEGKGATAAARQAVDERMAEVKAMVEGALKAAAQPAPAEAPPPSPAETKAAAPGPSLEDAPAKAEPAKTYAPGNAWVIREKATGAVIMETTDPKKVEALNTKKYEAVPVGQHLAEVNDPTTKAYQVARGAIPETRVETTAAAAETPAQRETSDATSPTQEPTQGQPEQPATADDPALAAKDAPEPAPRERAADEPRPGADDARGGEGRDAVVAGDEGVPADEPRVSETPAAEQASVEPSAAASAENVSAEAAPATAAEAMSTAESARAEVRSLFGAAADNVVTVVEDVTDLPPELQARWPDAGRAATVGKRHIFIVANRFPQGQVRGVVMHELGVHYGLKSEDVSRLTAQVQDWAKGDGPYAEMARNAIKAAQDSPTQGAGRQEETLAYMVQALVDSGVDPTQPGSVLGRFFKAIVDALKRAAQALGLRYSPSAQDVVDFVHGAARLALSNGSPKLNAIPSNPRTVPVAAEAEHEAGDIRFEAGLGAALRDATNHARELHLMAGYKLGDLFDSSGTLSFWDKSLGTPYHLAQRSPQFKRVFDRVQRFINDVSLYATRSADKAPTILPKLQTWRDLAKSAIPAEDAKALQSPIFEGTLVWTRGSDGKPVRMSERSAQFEGLSSHEKAQQMLREGVLDPNTLRMWRGKTQEAFDASVETAFQNSVMSPGIVWTDAELKSQWKLTDDQVKLYHEFRDAVNDSLDSMVKSEVVKLGGDDIDEPMRNRLMDMKADDAAIALRDHLWQLAASDEARAEALNKAADNAVKVADKLKALKDNGYAPLMRFGTHTLHVVGENGETLYFSLYDTAHERARAARQVVPALRQDHPGLQVETGTLSQEAYKLFQGVSPETLSLFGELLGLDSTGDKQADKAFQLYLQAAKSQRSAMKRLIHRKGVAGYSEDVGRVLAGFVYSNGRQTAANLHMGEVDRATQAIADQHGQGQLTDAAIQLRDYVKVPQEEAQGTRAMLYMQYLGGSVASAMVNALQPIQVTIPYLSQHGGITKAAGNMRKAWEMARPSQEAKLPADLRAAMKLYEATLSPQEVHQLQAQAGGKANLVSGDGTMIGNATARASNGWAKTSIALAKVFSVAEQWNRRTSFIAAYLTAQEQGIADPGAFAKKAVDDTQFVMNKGNRPKWARGSIGAVLFQFKTYGISYLELLHRMWTQGGPEGKKATLMALGVLFMMSGADGLPFEDDMEDVLDGFMQRLGYNWSTQREKKRILAQAMGEDLARFITKGASGFPGMPLDVSGRLGLGNMIPGTGLLTKKQDHTKDVVEIAGPIGDFATRAFQAAGQVVDGSPVKGATTLAPTFARNAIKGWEMATTGQYKDQAGNKVVDVSLGDAALKGIGFQPNAVARPQEANREVAQEVGLVKMRKTELQAAMAQAVYDKDAAAQAEVRAQRQAWNEKNPDARIDIDMAAVRRKVATMRLSKAERIEKTAPKAMRAQVREALQE